MFNINVCLATIFEQLDNISREVEISDVKRIYIKHLIDTNQFKKFMFNLKNDSTLLDDTVADIEMRFTVDFIRNQ